MRDRVYGRTDVELSAHGRDNAAQIAAALAAEPIAAIYTSPLRRARETSAPLARALGVEPVTIDDLREIDFGELEGLMISEALARYPVEAQWTIAPAEASFPGGEALATLRERAVRATRALAGRHPGETAAVFTHAVVIRAIVVDALGMPANTLFRLDQSFGGLTVIEWLDGLPFVRAVNATRL